MLRDGARLQPAHGGSDTSWPRGSDPQGIATKRGAGREAGAEAGTGAPHDNSSAHAQEAFIYGCNQQSWAEQPLVSRHLALHVIASPSLLPAVHFFMHASNGPLIASLHRAWHSPLSATLSQPRLHVAKALHLVRHPDAFQTVSSFALQATPALLQVPVAQRSSAREHVSLHSAHFEAQVCLHPSSLQLALQDLQVVEQPRPQSWQPLLQDSSHASV